MSEGMPIALETIAVRRAAEPEEISALVAYLASDASPYSTGSEFVADGGMSAGFALPSDD